MLSYDEVKALTVEIRRKPHEQLTARQIEMLSDELVGENTDESRLAALLTLADELEWLAFNDPLNIELVLVPYASAPCGNGTTMGHYRNL